MNIVAPKGKTFFGFQKEGIQFLGDHPNALLASEMGLGKSAMVIGLINSSEDINNILIICPASLKLMWRNELSQWLTRKLTVGIAAGNSFPDADIVIINYDILARHYNNLREYMWDLRITDEVHYTKNPKSIRTRNIIGYYKDNRWEIEPIPAIRKIAVTGTPIVNRPVELWPILLDLDPHRWNSYDKFTKRYCNAHNNGWGLDVSGASHLEELGNILRSTIMIRHLKAEVLKELPPKIRQVIVFPVPIHLKELIRKENEEWDIKARRLKLLQKITKDCANEEEYREAVRKLRAAYKVAFSEMSRIRHETALTKLPLVITYLKDVMNNGNKVVVFAHHHDVIEGISEAFSDSVSFYGKTPKGQRQSNIEEFQNNPDCKMFIGSIQAAGVGITLTASSLVIFAELDWVPGNMSQAENRTHRISQHNSVLVQHLVYEGSLDSRMSKMIVAKQIVIDQVVR
jgi:SWI/SNF-related matrix-associated actin-dependent regulator 1 of chromatin subfamily A